MIDQGQQYVTFRVPGPAQAWERAGYNKKGGRACKGKFFTPEKTARAERSIGEHGLQAMRGRPPFNCAVTLCVRIYMLAPESWTDAKKAAAIAGDIRPTSCGDTDNLVKTIMDGLTKSVYRDDRLVCGHSVDKFYATREETQISVVTWDFERSRQSREVA